jgi:hypothetical protein
MKKYAGLFPYPIQILQELKEADYPRRLQFAEHLLAIREVDADWIDPVMWSDQAHFYSNGQVCTYNCRIWASENPHAIIQQGLHDKKLTVWVGFTSSFLLGPYFFLDDDLAAVGQLQTVSVNALRYLEMLDSVVIPDLDYRQELDRTTFQQDGARPHIQRDVRQYLQDYFGSRIISQGFPNLHIFEWPARSPDLNPCDYFLWGYSKSLVYADQPEHLHALRAWIIRQCQDLSPNVLRKSVDNLLFRLRLVSENEGGDIEE